MNLASATTDEDPTVMDPEERKRRFGQHDHVRLYGRDFPERLQAAGFAVEEFSAAQLFGAQVAEKCLLGQERIYLSKK